MPDVELFSLLGLNTAKVSGVAVTATSDASPQTIATLNTPSLVAGTYMLAYSFQVTHSAKNQPLFFKTSGDASDAAYFTNSASVNDELHVNRFYAYPVVHAGGVYTLKLDAYKPIGGATFDFVDLMFNRVA